MATMTSDADFGHGSKAADMEFPEPLKDMETSLQPQPGEIGGVKQDLRRRHVNMITIAGMIGTGLFLASGQAIAVGGPVGALFGYIFMGLIACGVALTSGELAAFMPVTAGFIRHATKFVQPALGIATGWNTWYCFVITGPAELSAAATLINFWNSSINPAAWYSIMIVVIVIVNYCGVRIYGESEVFFAMLKIMLIVGLIIAGIVVNAGGGPNHEYLGFRYWRDPGPFNAYLVDGNTGKFLGFWSTLISAGLSYANIQVVAMAGAETRSPRVVIPNAMKMTFWRVAVFYILSIFIVGLLVPYNDEHLGVSTGTAQQSPFVIAFERAGISVLPSIINAVVLTSAFSCGSACVFLASRALYGLAEEGQAPRFFMRTNRFGSPWVAVTASIIFLPLVYLSLGSNSSIVFGWFVNITTTANFINWIVIEVTFLRFYYALRAQGIDRDRLPYKSPLQPYAAWATLVAVILVTLFSGYSVFLKGHWSTSAFLTSYINIPIFLVLWAVAWIFVRTGAVSICHMDLSEIDDIEAEKRANAEAEVVETRTWWRRWLI